MRKWFKYVLLFFSLNLWYSLQGQLEYPDSIFLVARNQAFEGDFEKAIFQLEQLTKLHPSNEDYLLFLSSVYFWNKQEDKALAISDQLWSKGNRSFDFVRLYLNQLVAKGYFEKVIAVVDSTKEAMVENNSEEDTFFFDYKKALALAELGRNDEALALLSSFPKNQVGVLALRTKILSKQPNMFSLSYLNTTFLGPNAPPWNIWHAEYLRKQDRITYIGRLNYGSLFGTRGFQAEFELYPKINDNSYLFINTGVSDGQSVFPLFRGGIEYFYERKWFSGSVGTRYLHFESDRVYMFLGQLGYNHKDYLFAYKPFFVVLSGELFPSHILNIRKSYEDRESFIQLDIQYGGLPYYFFASEEFARLSAYRAGVNARWRVKDNLFIQPIVMYELEEFVPNSYRNRLNIQLILSKRF